MGSCGRRFVLAFGLVLATGFAGASAPAAVAQEGVNADTAFGGFRESLVEDLADVRARLAQATAWVRDPDWYLVQTPDTGLVGVRRSELPLHAALLADSAFATRVDVLDDPVHAWDEAFTMALGLIRDAGGDPLAAAERLQRELTQTDAEKRAMLRQERQALRGERDELAAAIAAFDEFAAGLGLQPTMTTTMTPAAPARPTAPLDLVIAFRDRLVADRVALQARMAGCRAAIDEENVVAFGEQERFKFRDRLRLSGVTVFDLPTLPDYVDFPAHLRDDLDSWDLFDTIFAPETARRSSLVAAMLLFSFWQDWPPDMRGSAERAWRVERRTQKQDRSVCRPLLELLRPERARLDAAIAALDEYLVGVELDAPPRVQPTLRPTATPTARPSPPPEPADTPAPNPFADL